MDDNVKSNIQSKLVLNVEQAIDALLLAKGKPPIYRDSKATDSDSEPPFCSFCGKGRNQVNQMLDGNNVYICNQCVALCQEIIANENSLKNDSRAE